MKITNVRALLLVFPLPAVFMPAWARGRPMHELTMVLAEVETDEGITGLGAAHGGAEVLVAIERFVRPYLLGQDPIAVEALTGILRDAEILGPPEFGVMPFWFWNDDLDDRELIRRLHVFHAGGVGGVVIHPRVGLSRRVGYLTETYFRLVRRIVDECAVLGMRVILYDEGGYPSGSACGQVIAADPAYAARGLIVVQRTILMDPGWAIGVRPRAVPFSTALSAPSPPARGGSGAAGEPPAAHPDRAGIDSAGSGPWRLARHGLPRRTEWGDDPRCLSGA